jgi:predicted RNA-binding Zn ribbon-like protein
MRKRQEAPGELERVRAFLNTADLEEQTDQLSDPRALASWLVDQGLAPSTASASQGDFDHAVEVREALRALLLAHNGIAAPDQTGATLDAAARRAKLQLRFDRGGSARLEPDAGGIDGALGRLLAIVHGAIGDRSWNRLKACRDESCHWAFYDHTKNRSGAWCTMEVCGNRAKARTYRERRATATTHD